MRRSPALRGRPRFCRTRLLLLLLVVCVPTSVHAQRRPASVQPGVPPSPLLHVRDAPADAVLYPATLMREAQQQSTGRHTRRGLVIGAIIGAAGGIGFGTLIGLFCEGEGDSCWAAVPLIGLLGAAGGGALGAIIGSAVPRGDDATTEPDVVETPEPDTAAAREPTPGPPEREPGGPAAANRTGSFGGSFGWANATIEGGGREAFSGSGSMVRFAGYAELRRWLAIGLEVGHASFGAGGAVRHAAVAFRGTVARRTASPFIAANLGAYQSTLPSLEYLGAGIGAGVRFTPFDDRRFFIDAEGRWSRNAHNVDPTRMTSLSVGGGFYW